MRVILRADGNEIMGLGHLYRVFALGQILVKKFKVIIITKEDSNYEIFDDLFEIKLIKKNKEIINELKEFFSKISVSDIIILDGYQFNSEYQKRIKENGNNLIIIDDLAENHICADAVINHSPGISSEEYKSESYTKFYLGPKYSILRQAFLNGAQKLRTNYNYKIAFVSFGGSDQFDFSYKMVKSLVDFNYFEKINVIIGNAYRYTTIYNLASKYEEVKFFKNIDEIQLFKLMSESGIAFSSVSNIIFELFAAKTPVITGYYVENQLRLYNYLDSHEFVIGLGNLLESDFSKIKKMFFDSMNFGFETKIFKMTELIDDKVENRIQNIISSLV